MPQIGVRQVQVAGVESPQVGPPEIGITQITGLAGSPPAVELIHMPLFEQ